MTDLQLLTLALKAVDVTALRFLSQDMPRERFERLFNSTHSMLGCIAKEFGHPQTDDIQLANAHLNLITGYLIGEKRKKILIMLFAVRLSLQSHYDSTPPD